MRSATAVLDSIKPHSLYRQRLRVRVHVRVHLRLRQIVTLRL